MHLYEHLVLLFVGICLFMYGMGLSSENLQILAADRVRALMAHVSRHRVLGIFSGIFLTVILQSSAAVTVMLVNLASAGVITLSQIIGVVIGTTIGTTVTVQLLSYNVTVLGPYLLIAGSAILFFSQERRARQMGSVIFGFGLLFYGLHVIGDAVSIVKDLKEFKDIFKYLGENPMVAFFVTIVMTVIFHSSAVTIGISMALATSGVLSVYDSLFWVAGANLGTTASGIFASFSSRHAGRQVAWAHFIYKVAGVILLFIFIKPFAFLLSQTSVIAGHQIANAHTLLNIISAIVFYPFIGYGVRFLERIYPVPKSEREFGAKYLDPNAFKEPHHAYANAIREMLRMADYAYEMVRLSIGAFEKDNPDMIDEIKTVDKKIDILNRETKIYLVRLADEKLSESQHARVVNMIALVSDIENIGDVVDSSILALARKKSNLKVTFSNQGWDDMKCFHSLVMKNFELAISAFSLGSKELAQKVIQNKHELRVMEHRYREAHIQRLHMKMQESMNTSNIHFDLLSAYRRVNSYACSLAYLILFGDPKSFDTDQNQKKSS